MAWKKTDRVRVSIAKSSNKKMYVHSKHISPAKRMVPSNGFHSMVRPRKACHPRQRPKKKNWICSVNPRSKLLNYVPLTIMARVRAWHTLKSTTWSGTPTPICVLNLLIPDLQMHKWPKHDSLLFTD